MGAGSAEAADSSGAAAADARGALGPYRAQRDLNRRRTKEAAAQEIGTLSDRELLLLGVGLYWAEGAKSKPYRVAEDVVFVNSDPDMIRVFLRWLGLLGIGAERLSCRVMIHESGDASSAEHFWADVVGATVESFKKTTLKRHNPRTVRKNIGPEYRGCLVVRVRQGADLYRRIEGWWAGIARPGVGRGV